MADKPTKHRGHILVVDDDLGTREALEAILDEDYEVICVQSGFDALAKIKEQIFDLVLMDITMPGMDGIETLSRIREYDENIHVVMISALDHAYEATEAMKCGAYDYITKPYDPEQILKTVERVLEKLSLEKEVLYLRSEIALQFEKFKIISQAPNMQDIFKTINKVAQSTSSVLITGESGTGKELIARAIHTRSQRAHKPFVAVNCAAIPAELMESELLGHEKGAFTGALNRVPGKFEFADGGTIFLDEISSMKLELQAKLLRVLQEREFTRIGSHIPIKVDVRVIAATNTNLEEMIKKGLFRSDLYFRLNVIPINLPPLRERKGDVPQLANYFLRKLSQQLNKKIKGITVRAMNLLESYPWPGNIRELENLIERLVVLSNNNQYIDEKDLPFDLFINEETAFQLPEGQNRDSGLIEARQDFERKYILRALKHCRWNQTNTAKMLKIHRNTLLQKMKSLNIYSGENDSS